MATSEDLDNKTSKPRPLHELRIIHHANPPTFFARVCQNKDSSFTYVHMHRGSDAELFEDFCRDKLPDDEIYVPPQHQPINPEDEDDVVPDQHAAFGIQRATQRVNEPAWKDLGLASLMDKGPDANGKRNSGKGAMGIRNLPR